MKLLISLSITLLATSVTAQIALPAFSRTYNGSHRGQYFQAPVAFVLTGLQVPNESNATGKQIVAVYAGTASGLTAAPPAYSASVAVTPTFYSESVDAGNIVPVIPPILVAQGDWVAVLGAIGGVTGSVANSYAISGCTPSSVLGSPISLCRCGIQANIATSKGAGALWSENGGGISRVRMYVTGAGQAITYGGPSNGDGALGVNDTNPPNINATGILTMSAGAVAGNTGGFLAIGLTKSSIKTVIGELLAFPHLILLPTGGAMPAAGTPFSFPIPNDTTLLGSQFYFQGAFGSPAGFHLTDGMEWTVGQ